ncbi:hypothetical protein U0C82_18780 [Fulvimarina sp. 2208YS6-2-32]|uniref:Uncharacterized protein n=1 Tax=Fulvimarina uroteuthidis TaxID=3098149 RepID=A0ABU5I6Z3_9HYPH|nr:hypothetical protein [Fulvimarina sp. 2208YS6-2-32]MDY8111166.1 hypothetical protein [Fulvimarina sp. 2208YS6-2-32]
MRDRVGDATHAAQGGNGLVALLQLEFEAGADAFRRAVVDLVELIDKRAKRRHGFDNGALEVRADCLGDRRELAVDLVGLGDHLVVHDDAEVVRLFNQRADTVRALVQKLDKALAAGAAEEFIGNTDLRRLVQALHPFDDLNHQGRWVFEFGGEFVRAIAQALEGVSTGAGAGHDELVSAKVQFLHAVDQGVDLDPVDTGDVAEFLKRLRRQAGALRLVSNVREGSREFTALVHNAGKTDRRNTSDARLQARTHSLAGLRENAFQVRRRLLGVPLDPREVLRRDLTGAVHRPFEVADLRLEADCEFLFVCSCHWCPTRPRSRRRFRSKGWISGVRR